MPKRDNAKRPLEEMRSSDADAHVKKKEKENGKSESPKKKRRLEEKMKADDGDGDGDRDHESESDSESSNSFEDVDENIEMLVLAHNGTNADEFKANPAFRARTEAPHRDVSLKQLAEGDVVLIVGQSGVGKTSLVAQLAKEAAAAKDGGASEFYVLQDAEQKWDADTAVIDEVGKTRNADFEAVVSLMSSIGLNDVPSWLQPHWALSEGQKFRARVVRFWSATMSKKGATGTRKKRKRDIWMVIDEFTSTVDRDTAKCMSAAFARFVRQQNQKAGSKVHIRLVLVSASTDIAPLLQPDLVVSLAEMGPQLPRQEHEQGDLRILKNTHADGAGALKAKVVLNVDKLRNRHAPRSRARIQRAEQISDSIKIERTWPLADTRQISTTVTSGVLSRRASCVFDVVSAEQTDEEKEEKTRFEVWNGQTTTEVADLSQRDLKKIGRAFDVLVITGSSGSGKTSIARRHFGGATIDKLPRVNEDETVFALFDALLDSTKALETLALLFWSVFLTAQHGFQKYRDLSQGEKERVNILRVLVARLDEQTQGESGSFFVIDEYSSFVDRVIAVEMTRRLRFVIWKQKLDRLVFGLSFSFLFSFLFFSIVIFHLSVACHFDVALRLRPRCLIDLDTQTVQVRVSLPFCLRLVIVNFN